MADLPGEAATMNQLLVRLNQLTLKALSARTRKALVFLVVNDTRRLVRYDRATLWDISGSSPIYLGSSGQTQTEAGSPLITSIADRLSSLHNRLEMQALSLNFAEGAEAKHGVSNALWLPMVTNELPSIGLLLERWHDAPWMVEELKVLTFIRQSYGEAWRHFMGIRQRMLKKRRSILYGALGTVFLLFVIPVPLRIVAPCEVVAENPFLITAPLEGIVDHIDVNPGDMVKEGALLFSYDKRVPLQELAIAEKAVNVVQANLTRAMTLGWTDSKALEEAAVLKLELDKEKLNYELAKYNAQKLAVSAPITGVAIFDDPDKWRGKPVAVGEAIMVVADPTVTKVRLWIPEADKVDIDLEEPIKIFLNVAPTVSYKAHIRFIGEYSSVTDTGINSYMGEADWISKPEGARLGLKGSAILYGENVSIFYFIMRKPWNYLRDLFGF